MFNRKKESKFKKIFSNQVTITLLGLVIIVLISIPLAKNISKQYKINNEIKLLQEEISNLEGKNTNLKNLITFLESDQFVDEEARKNLNFKKEGEEVVVIKDELLGATESTDELNSKYIINQPKEEKKRRLSNPEKWLKYFFINNNI